MSTPILRVSKGYPRVKKHLDYNEARCSRYVGIILATYDTYQPYKPFPEVLRHFGMTPETIEHDELLQLCLEWRNEDDTNTEIEVVSFFNKYGKGNRLEELLQKHCPDLSDLYPIEETMRRRRAAKQRSSHKRTAALL